MVLAGVTDPDCKAEMGLLLYKDMSGIQEIQQGVLVLPGLIISQWETTTTQFRHNDSWPRTLQE